MLQASDLHGEDAWTVLFDLSAEEIAQFVSDADTNHDGVVEYNEFQASKGLNNNKMHSRNNYLNTMFERRGSGIQRDCRIDLSSTGTPDGNPDTFFLVPVCPCVAVKNLTESLSLLRCGFWPYCSRLVCIYTEPSASTVASDPA